MEPIHCEGVFIQTIAGSKTSVMVIKLHLLLHNSVQGHLPCTEHLISFTFENWIPIISNWPFFTGKTFQIANQVSLLQGEESAGFFVSILPLNSIVLKKNKTNDSDGYL